jgi:hypothetical protein
LPDPAATQLALADLFREMANQLRYDDVAARLLADLQREEGDSRPQPVPAVSRHTPECAPSRRPRQAPRRANATSAR